MNDEEQPTEPLDEEWAGYESVTYYTHGDYEAHGEHCPLCNQEDLPCSRFASRN